MILYTIIALYYIVCMLFEKILEKQINRKMWLVFLLLPLFFMAALRAPTVGTDTLNYYQSYLIISQESFFSESASRMEIGYVMLARLLSTLGLDFLGFQIVTTAFIFFSFGKFILKYSKNIAFSVYFFVASRMFFATMNISRQYIAVAILLLSVEFIKKRQFLKFFLIVLLASLFHTTAIVFLVIYPIVQLRLNFKKTIVFISLGIVSGILFDYIVQLFINITGRYQEYLAGGYFNFEGNVAIYFNLLINFSFFIVGVLIRYWDIPIKMNNNCDKLKGLGIRKVKLISNETIWYASCLITFILSIVGLNSTIMDRIETYFTVFFLAYIPSLVQGIKSKEIRVIVTGSIVIGLFANFVLIMIYRPNWNLVFPYNWYWNWNW
ncbi:EpsG family protein [Priestia megaterium]|uniref:EpsG family protein n=1 Tax=Priestia megaterium TaxID=1404 RepID=UPI003872DDC4|nr:EpsG family protein [Priestia megaterium]